MSGDVETEKGKQYWDGINNVVGGTTQREEFVKRGEQIWLKKH